jgi:hypothetical protein
MDTKLLRRGNDKSLRQLCSMNRAMLDEIYKELRQKALKENNYGLPTLQKEDVHG